MSKSSSYSFHKLTAFFLLVIFSNNFNVFAQTRKSNNQNAANQPKAAAKCSGAWTGTIIYTRQQTMTDNKTIDRVSMRGRDTRDWEMKYDYKAQISVVESPERNGQSVGKARVDHKFHSIEKNTAVEKNSCDRGKTWQDMKGEFTSKTETTGKDSVDANVNVGVNSDGSYTVSVAIPQIMGENSGSQTSSFSGQCTAKEGKTLTQPKTPMTIEGNSLTSDGKNQWNPSDPNRLSGTYRYTWQNVTETITWNLQKCGAPLRIMDLKFEDMKFPNWNDWQEISEQKGTIDGNLIKIKAKILNASGETKYADLKFKETYKGDKWDGARPDGLLENGEVSVRLEAGEEKDVEIVWDSSGYSWFDDGRPRLVQRIKAELEENGKKTDEITRNLKIAPKPVVLVHGAWSHWKQFETWQNIFTTTHSYDWKAFPVGENINKGIINTGRDPLSSEETNSTPQNAESLKSYVRYAQEDRNAWHVDIVAHSIGGLIARYYINKLMPDNALDGRPTVSHLLMLGTPNLGTPCADVMDFAFEATGKSPRVVREMRQDSVAEFNRSNPYTKGVKFSALAGNSLPVTCKTIVPNDGFVPVPSALWTIKDTAQTSEIHTDLTGTKVFSDFVRSRLAIGPKGDHTPDLPPIPVNNGEYRQNNSGAFFINAAYHPNAENSVDDKYKPDFARRVKIPAKQSIEIEIPVQSALNFGLTFMALSDVSATLYDDKGAIVGKNLTKTPAANGWFRSIFIDKPVTKSIWKLKLENTSTQEFEAIIAGWKNAVRK
jgi:pimeloyl-ACP methyl ester carboxylesterase